MDEALYTAYLDGSLLLTERGQWIHNGTPFTNRNLISLFHRSIIWNEEESRYFIRIGKGQATFLCEDTAYFVSGLCDQKSPWEVVLLDGSREHLRSDTLYQGADHQIYCLVKGGHPARFLKNTHQILLEHVLDNQKLLIDGEEISLIQRSHDEFSAR